MPIRLWMLLGIYLTTLRAIPVMGQHLTFRTLGNGQVVSGVGSFSCTYDHRGFLWISTNDGLLRFNGKEVRAFYQEDYPGLSSDQTGALFCDSQNKIWVSSTRGLASVDQYAQVEKQRLVDSSETIDVKLCMEAADGRIFALTRSGAFARSRHDPHWSPQPWLDSIIQGQSFRDVRPFDAHRYQIVLRHKSVVLINLTKNQLDVEVPLKGVVCAAKFDDTHLLCGAGPGFKLMKVDLKTPHLFDTIAGPSFFDQKNPHEQLSYIIRGADHNFYMSTTGRGLLSLDSNLKNYTSYVHDPVNPTTIITNAIRHIVTDSAGNFAVASMDGISYTNLKNTEVELINYLKTTEGEIIDDQIISIAEDQNEKLWICTPNAVFIYDPLTHLAMQVRFPPALALSAESIHPMCVESDGDHMWLSLRNTGIFIFSPEGQLLHQIRGKQFPKFRVGIINQTRVLRKGKDGFMYAGGEDGLFRISIKDLKLDTFAMDTALLALRYERIIDILPLSDAIWFSSSPDGAAWKYSFQQKKLKSYSLAEGLNSRRIYGIAENGDGNIYLGSYLGFSIIHASDSIRNMTKGQGLISPRVESLEAADDGSIWITNNYNLLKFDPASDKIYKLGGRQGLTGVNFSVMASAKLKSGKLVFGTNNGMIIVNPATIRFDDVPLNMMITYSGQDGRELQMLPGKQVRFSFRQQNLRFSFAVSDLMIADQVMYRYRLSGVSDGNWSSPTSNSMVDFALNSGSYVLEVEAYDGNRWNAMEAPLLFTIALPWWKQWWFLVLLFVVFSTIVIVFFKTRLDKYKREMYVSRQITELESRALRAQMNPHFVFNSLNAIQECIVTGKVDEAYKYLSKFSKLLRMVLEHSDAPEVSLQEELEVLHLYVELEKLRFKDDMQFSFHLEEDLDAEEIHIPPMLMQPHLENAIWHGLRHKEGNKKLVLSIREVQPGYLLVTIEDDGIGRKISSEMRQARLGGNQQRSRGTQLSQNRMELLMKTYPLTSIHIQDLEHPDGSAAGTSVLLSIPMLGKRSGMSKLNP